MVGMNGKLNASLITGTGIENLGAEPGEVLKAIRKSTVRKSAMMMRKTMRKKTMMN